MRTLFLNDVGFQYGAGIAHARQVQSMLLGGDTVAAVCGDNGQVGDGHLFTREGLRARWHGMRSLTPLFQSPLHSEAEIVDGVLMAVAEFYPDLVVVGNLHAANWPFRLLRELHRLRCRVVAYLHDLYAVTGRCVYPEDCGKYLTGCDASCPTPREYPPLDPSRIADAWTLRRTTLVDGPHIELATNSDYMQRIVREAMPTATIGTVYLGADDRLFQPGDRAAARRQLDLPDDGLPIVLTGAVTWSDRRKGARFVREIMERFKGRAHFIAFGLNSSGLPGLHALGYRTNPAEMVAIYRASDVFLGTSIAEAFGQVILEASLCGVPTAAFATGGIPEMITDGVNGLLAPSGNGEAIGDALGRLLDDDDLRRTLGAAARASCAERFSLEQQRRNWERFLAPVAA